VARSTKEVVWAGLLNPDGVELSVGSYARAPVEIINGELVNGMSFPEATSDWGEVTYFALYPTQMATKPLLVGGFGPGGATNVQCGNQVVIGEMRMDDGAREQFYTNLDAHKGVVPAGPPGAAGPPPLKADPELRAKMKRAKEALIQTTSTIAKARSSKA